MIAKQVVRPIRREALLLAWRLRWGHKPYGAYLRYLMDAEADRDPRSAVGGLWDVIGNLQLHFLQSQGLRPEHSLLDIGCGCLRGGLHFIRYLEPGNYWGLDISPRILEAGQRFLREAGLVDRKPHLLLTKDFGFSELNGQRFDCVQAFAVFTDLPAAPIRECFANLHQVLSQRGVFFATFVPGDRRIADPVRAGFRYPLHFFQELGRRNNYSVEMIEGFRHPRGHRMLAIRPAAGKRRVI